MYNSGTKAIFRLSVDKNETHVSIGLFQGHLGWQKTTVLLEEGVAEFSNIQGLNQTRLHYTPLCP